MALADYQSGSANWRATLQQNNHRTKIVIALFLLIYVGFGLFLDVLMVLETPELYGLNYEEARFMPVDRLVLLAIKGLLSFQLTPYFTMITAVVATCSICYTIWRSDKVMLMGTDSTQITANGNHTAEEMQLYNIVEELKIAAGMQYMPKVYIIEADYMNAFASGYSEKSAMVAITRGLLNKLDRNETQAVMAHELSHIRHQDIKLTLMASVLSNIMLIILDIFFRGILYSRNRKSDGRILIVLILLRILLPLLTIVIMMYLSRTREYMADAGAVELMRDNQPMARALLKIHQDHERNRDAYSADYQSQANEQVRRASYLYDPTYAGLKTNFNLTNIFSTHPSLEKRLKALGYVKRS